MIDYTIENDLSPDEFKSVLIRSTLGERRPVDSIERISKMIHHANLIITARDNGKLIGVGRSLTDFAFCTYMSDLAVDVDYQKGGVGKEIIRRTKLETPEAKLILLAAPAARGYYPKIGMPQFEYCFILDDVSQLK
ncbi:MAG TPA: GNAT family N-acetyltransferase [Cyclobacteriaceae bacterium]|nr:GNAT family N-acetyltransferase [Cyclobacteriaceae bacterium]